MFHHLKQFHKIVPDAEYARRSRAAILRERPLEVAWYRRAGVLVGSVLESGSAIALAGLALFVLVGGFSLMRYFSASNGINLNEIRAEAEAIDIQIQMADVKYNYSSPQGSASPRESASFRIAGKGSASSAATSAPAESSSTPSGATVDEKIDDALMQLANP